MKTPADLAQRSCHPHQRALAVLTPDEQRQLMSLLNSRWRLNTNGTSLTCHQKFAGFTKAAHFSNLVAYLADTQGHHPDISFGWGYCTVRYTSHEQQGLTESDFICAAKLDQLIDTSHNQTTKPTKPENKQ